MSTEKVELKCRGGGYLGDIKPKFSSCEESIYVARNSCIFQYSTKTGLLLSKYQDSSDLIVGFDIVNLNSSESIIACTRNGEVTAWKAVTHFKTLTKKIECSNLKTFHYLPGKHEDDTLEAIVTYIHKDKTYVALVDISKGSFKKFKLKLKEGVIIGISNRRFFAVADKYKIHFICVDNPGKKNSVFLTEEKNQSAKHFTCLECHAEEEIVITGDSEGKVLLWYNIFSKNPAKSLYHWHTLPVNCLSFSTAGSYFYSGGNESVLVRWDWENTQNRKFLPRLSGKIQHISVSSQSQLVAVSTSDNGIRILDSAFNDINLIQHLVIGENYKCGILLDPRTKALVMNGSVGQIQFYQPKTETLLYSIDVVGQNKLTDERNLSIENTQVIKFAISRNGLWLATVEERKDLQCSHHELRLKFWNFNSSQQVFELNSSIEKPHQNSITSIEFQFLNSDEQKCVTIGEDKKFKVWHKTTVEQLNIDRITWNCLTVGFYKDLPCKGLSFSADGSLMGVGFGPIVTTWTPDTCQLKCSLVYTGHKTNIENLQFGTSNQCHLIVAATKNRLSVWNLLTLTMIWTVPLEVELLLANKLSIHMAVITKSREIFVFSPNSPNPVYSSEEMLEKRDVIAAAFIPTPLYLDVQSKWFERMELYLIDTKKELFSIGIESSDEHWPLDSISDTAENVSLYNKMMPFKKVSSTSVGQRKHLFQKDSSQKVIRKYLDSPVHTMIPIRLSCASLIKSFLVQKNTDIESVDTI
ncbi:hypothetical protein HHI36_011922 [Cryptolaemus montrouzieri]|uniref:WD repeat-containing protein 75 second beta-propeller domain-containing protein n=1 Tax=Cryptolaemus montrouzieri TaxID=559131 RepID=A0ABD2ND19_9CUCU